VCLVVGLDGMCWLQPSFWSWLQSLSVCLVPGPSGLGWFHPLFWDGSNPSHVWLIVLGWVGSIPFFCLVGGIGKKGQMVYLTPFATVLMGPTVSVTPYLLPHHRIRAPPRALPPPPPAPPATRRRRGRPRLRPRPRVPLAEHAADLRRPRRGPPPPPPVTARIAR